MSDIVNVRSMDIQSVEGTSSYYLPDHSSSTLVDALGTLLELAQVAAVDNVDQVQNWMNEPDPVPAAGETPLVSQAAALLFHCDDDTDYVAYVLGPKDGTFLPGGAVDDSQTWVSDLIQWLLDNATNPTGSPLATYTSGEYVELTPGWMDVNGAAAFARESGLVSEFWPQDGVDVKVGE